MVENARKSNSSGVAILDQVLAQCLLQVEGSVPRAIKAQPQFADEVALAVLGVFRRQLNEDIASGLRIK